MKNKPQYIARIKNKHYGPYTYQDKQDIDSCIKHVRWVVILK